MRVVGREIALGWVSGNWCGRIDFPTVVSICVSLSPPATASSSFPNPVDALSPSSTHTSVSDTVGIGAAGSITKSRAKMASQRNGGPSVISPPSSFRSLDPFPQLSPTASSSSRPSGPPRNARQQSIMSTFSSLAEFTPTKASSAYSASRQYTPNPNLRHISSSSVLPSDSGASTPDYKRRARRMAEKGLIKEGERDWGNVEPDEVFRKLPVLEVRRVEGKMRQEALDKQSELRAMVG